ncbi:MAG TPA: YicC family protein [Candidatus Hydrogenedens sp.]|nr:YicC family protein [Candidatus Hydrogenedens sp.]
MRSMTGFGNASGIVRNAIVSLEINSVNHRSLEISIRVPSLWGPIETFIRDKIRQNINRGKIHFWMRRQSSETTGPSFTFNENVVKEYLEHIKKLKQILNTDEEISINTLIQLPGIFETTITDEEIELIKLEMEPLIDLVIENLNKSREIEGQAIKKQIQEHFNELRSGIHILEQKTPELLEQQKERIRTKLAEISLDPSMKEERLAMETILWADKLDITEEINRVNTHLSRAHELLEMEQNGKPLNFLIQEMGRELNTISAKLRDADLAWLLVQMKTVLEKIREQIQNVE